MYGNWRRLDDQTCSGPIIYQAHDHLLIGTTTNPHHIVIHDPNQQLVHVLNNTEVETCRGDLAPSKACGVLDANLMKYLICTPLCTNKETARKLWEKTVTP